MIKKILLALLAVFLVLQFFRPERNRGSADGTADIRHAFTVPDTVMKILKKSCYDCHSNHTDYPWYMNINPLGWMMARHVREGKEELNFSEFTRNSRKRMDRKLAMTDEQVTKGKMPLDSYLILHRDARLQQGQVQILREWVAAARQELKGK